MSFYSGLEHFGDLSFVLETVEPLTLEGMKASQGSPAIGQFDQPRMVEGGRIGVNGQSTIKRKAGSFVKQ